jgi:hypothetical protein
LQIKKEEIFFQPFREKTGWGEISFLLKHGILKETGEETGRL